jgi:hypothetical protein
MIRFGDWLDGILGSFEGRGDQKGGSRREHEAAVEGSMTTAMLRWLTSVKDLRMSSSELWERYWCNQLGTPASD